MLRVARKPWKTVRAFILAGIGLAVSAGVAMLLLSHAQAHAPQQTVDDQVPAQGVERRFIGLPKADTVAIQRISFETDGTPTDARVEFVEPDGSFSLVTTETIPAEGVTVVVGPDDPTDLARIEYESESAYFDVVAADFSFTPSGNAAYLGMTSIDYVQFESSTAGSTIFMTELNKAYYGWHTEFTVQNWDPEDSANVRIDFYTSMGEPDCIYDSPVEIPPNGSMTLDLKDIACLQDGYHGSAVVRSQSLAPIAVGMVRGYQQFLGLRDAHPGVEMGATALVAPALFKEHDLQTSFLCVTNVGAFQSDVIVNYTDGIVNSATLPPMGTYCFGQSGEDHASGWAGGAEITSTQPMAAAVHVVASGGETKGQWAYNPYPLDQLAAEAQGGEMTLAFPLVFNGAGGWTSDIHLYNVTDLPATITPRYVAVPPSNLVICGDPFVVPAQSVVSISMAELPALFSRGMAYWNASQWIVAVTSGTSDALPGEVDRHFGYRPYHEGRTTAFFPESCSTIRSIFLPMIVKD